MMHPTDYSKKVASAQEILKKVLFEGANVVYGNAATCPDAFNQALFDSRDSIPRINIFHVLYYGKALHMTQEMNGKVRTFCNFMEKQAREAYAQGLVDFFPCHFHEVPSLFTLGYYSPDITVMQVAPPDEEGYCSFGLSCDYTKTAAELAKVVVAEVNPQMPRVGGRKNAIHLSQIDHIIEVDRPVIAVPPAKIGELEAKIGAFVASLIGDGATLQLGIGAIPDAVLSNLEDRKDLGIHTEMFSDGVMNLMKKGIITGGRKELHPGKVVSAFITGTKELYDFVDDNEEVELYPVDYTNDPFNIAKISNFVAINSAIEVDLFGQGNAESIGPRLFSGSGGQVDFLRGTKKSKGGFSVLALPSTAAGGKVSRIVPRLTPGALVTSVRNDVDYVVTEYGIARMRGKTMAERARDLIRIAHPQFKEELEDFARREIGYFKTLYHKKIY